MNFLNRKIVTLELVLCAFCVAIIICILFDETLSDIVADVLLLMASIIGGIIFLKMTIKIIRQKEQLEKANAKLKVLDAQKNELLSFATHQLCSPLSAVAGYASMLYEGSAGVVSVKQKEILGAMCESTHNLKIMLTDFLTISKIEQGGFEYEKNNFNLSLVAQEAARQMEMNVEIKGLSLYFKIDSDISYYINGDLEKIRQAIVTILDNSIKYTLSGRINIYLLKNNDSKNITLKIVDTGIGIEKEDMEKIFQKFARSKGAISVSSGSGLGLYLAKKIVEAHGGTIEVSSKGIGKGACFSIVLPQI